MCYGALQNFGQTTRWVLQCWLFDSWTAFLKAATSMQVAAELAWAKDTYNRPYRLLNTWYNNGSKLKLKCAFKFSYQKFRLGYTITIFYASFSARSNRTTGEQTQECKWADSSPMLPVQNHEIPRMSSQHVILSSAVPSRPKIETETGNHFGFTVHYTFARCKGRLACRLQCMCGVFEQWTCRLASHWSYQGWKMTWKNLRFC